MCECVIEHVAAIIIVRRQGEYFLFTFSRSGPCLAWCTYLFINYKPASTIDLPLAVRQVRLIQSRVQYTS